MKIYKRTKKTPRTDEFWRGVGWGLRIAQLWKQKDEEISLLQNAGNSGYSPATAYVMQLFREGKLFGETSLLRNKNLLGANWQNIILPKANLEGIILQYANLREAYLVETILTKANLRNAQLNNANLRAAKLQGTNFMQASLRKASLIGVDAKSASFFMAKLVRTQMSFAKLERVHLAETDLHGVNLEASNLTNGFLTYANFAEANLKRAILNGAHLENANLTGADLSGTLFSPRTILPDAKWLSFDAERKPIYDKYWNAETDMSRYTNPEHPNLWQAPWVKKYDWVQKNYNED